MFFDKGFCCCKNPYCVIPFSRENLHYIIQKSTLATNEYIETKAQLEYIYLYAQTMQTNTIIVEGDFLDKSYLEDYSSYYVKCFKKYQREVNRIHFFKNKFTKEDFDFILNNKLQDGIEALQSNYIGFTTIKKLPTTFIGKTCLKSLEPEGHRHFATLREYDVNLFGIDLSIEALAYQEQDSTVCACATSSLWSIFHSTGKLFQHPIPSPVEITKIATDQASSDTRIFPNKSLNLKMIASGIKNIGLEPYKVQIDDINMLKASLYAYLKANIPMLMAFFLHNTETGTNLEVGHAVAVIGYNMFNNSTTHFSPFKLKSFNINKIYVHDDQVGPYARMEIKTAQDNTPILTTSYGKDIKTGSEPYVSIPFALSIPLYKNIRIPFNNIFTHTIIFNSIISYFIEKLNFNWNFEWDLYLQSRKQLKAHILNNEYVNIDTPVNILTKNLPSYMWCCEIILNGELVLKVLFDATDIESNLNFVDIVKYKNANKGAFYDIFIDLCRRIYELNPDTITNQFICGFSALANYRPTSKKEINNNLTS